MKIFKTAYIFGKGPTFRMWPHKDAFERDVVLALNEAVWFLETRCDAVVCADIQAAWRVAWWCGVKEIPVIRPESEGWERAMGFSYKQIPGNKGWEPMSREWCSSKGRMFYTEGYSSTVAAWYAWLCGCNRIVTYGVGGEGYHPSFEGEPGNPKQGEEAVRILTRLCEVKGIELEVR